MLAKTGGPQILGRFSPLLSAGCGKRCPRSPGGPWAQYIRSGPEGARGVLRVRGWSFCTHPFCTHPFCTHPACSSLNSSEGHLFLKFPSWKSPFSEFSSTFVPPKVAFLEISAHSLHFSEIYLANYVGHMKKVFLLVVFLQVVFLLLSFCRMSVCVLLI